MLVGTTVDGAVDFFHPRRSKGDSWSRPEIGRVDEAHPLARQRDEASEPDAPAAAAFRQQYSNETRIRFVGVWDTVGALDIPFNGVALIRQR